MSFLNIAGGAGKFMQAAALEKVKGDQALRVSTAKANSAAAIKAKETDVTFKVGDSSITFNTINSLGSSDSVRAAGAITNITSNMTPAAYKLAMKTGTNEEKNKLNQFLLKSHTFWNSKNQEKVARGDVPISAGWKNVVSYHKDVLNYGSNYATKTIAPSYGRAVERWKHYYPKNTVWEVINKTANDKTVNYDFAPTKLMDNGTNFARVKEYQSLLGHKDYKETLRMFKLNNEPDLTSDRHVKVYDIMDDMRNEFGVISNITAFDQVPKLEKYRDKARELGIGNRGWMNMLGAITPDLVSFKNENVIYSDEKELLNYTNGYMKQKHNIDVAKEKQAGQGANAAAGTAMTMVNVLKETGPLGSPAGFAVDRMFRQVFSPTGALQSIVQVSGNWLKGDDRSLDSNGNISNPNSTAYVNNFKATYVKNLSNKGSSEKDVKARRAGQLQYMKFQLAYQMASALQGGTGGRTISDQDVENMLRAMRFTAGDDTRHIIASLENINQLMLETAAIKDYYASGPKGAYSAKLLERSIAQYGSLEQYTYARVADLTTNKKGGKFAVPSGSVIGNPIKIGPNGKVIF